MEGKNYNERWEFKQKGNTVLDMTVLYSCSPILVLGCDQGVTSLVAMTVLLAFGAREGAIHTVAIGMHNNIIHKCLFT
jgi:hypothetical protein